MTIRTKLIEAGDLQAKAEDDTFRLQCPDILKRLIEADGPEPPVEIRVPSVSSGTVPGRDVHTISKHGGRFTPKGQALWEIGTPTGLKAKLASDLEKRAELCMKEGNDPSQIVFIFVTFRKWASPEELQATAEEHTLSSPFKEVKIYDAVVLENWLELSPAVTRFVRKEYLNFSTLHTGWKSTREYLDEFAKRFDFSLMLKPKTSVEPPKFSIGLLLEGYEQQQEELKENFDRLRGRVGISAETEAEAIAFVAATLTSLSDFDSLQYRTIVIEDSSVISEFTELQDHIFILTEVISKTNAHKLDERNLILTASGRLSADTGTIKLLVRNAESFAKALELCGFDSKFTFDLAARVGRSLSVLWRQAPRAGHALEPAWHGRIEKPIVRSFILLGAIDRSFIGDRRCLTTLVGGNEDDALDELKLLLDGPDPLARRSGNLYALSSPVDAITFGASSFKTRDYRNFAELFIEVFNHVEAQPDPNEIYDPRRPTSMFSDALREGLAKSVLILSAQSATLDLECDERPLHDFLSEAFLKLTSQTRFLGLLESNSYLTSYFAEAFPTGFLKALGDMIEGEGADAVGVFDEFKHPITGDWPRRLGPLMNALSVLAWLDGHFQDAVKRLAQLAILDNGNQNHGPRPLWILKGVFSSWSPQTNASDPERLRALKAMIDYAPSVAKDVIVSTMPSSHGTQSVHARPVFSHAADQARTYGDIWAYSSAAAKLLFQSHIEPGDWIRESLDSASRLPAEAYNDFLSVLEDALAKKDDMYLWPDLNRLIERHERFNDANWSLPLERISALKLLSKKYEPEELNLRFGRLFDWDADWNVSDPKTDEEALRIRREDVVKQIYEEQGGAGIIDLALDSQNKQAVIIPITNHLALVPALDLAFNATLRDLKSWPALAAYNLFNRFGIAFIEELLTRLDRGQISLEQFGETVAGALRHDGLLPELWKLPSHLKQAVLKHAPSYAFLGLEAGMSDRIAAELLDANVPELTFRQGSEFWQSMSSMVLLEILESMMGRIAELRNQFPASDVLGAVAYLHERGDVADERLIRIELPFVRHSYQFESHNWVINQFIGREPERFLELLSVAYLADDEVREERNDDRTDVEKYWAENAFFVLYNIDNAGFEKDGDIDKKRFLWWYSEVLDGARKINRVTSAQMTVGRILADIPPRGATSLWPSKTVASILEELDSRELENSLAVAQFNSRGVFMGDGVSHSLEWATLREKAADRLEGYPITQAFLRRCAENDRQDAELARKRRENRELTDKL